MPRGHCGAGGGDNCWLCRQQKEYDEYRREAARRESARREAERLEAERLRVERNLQQAALALTRFVEQNKRRGG